jgi:uncharacterized protein YodC (DUF2158 family)
MEETQVDAEGVLMRWKFGDAVRLKSGGPRMLVVDIEGDVVICEWLDDTGAGQHHGFSHPMLKAA